MLKDITSIYLHSVVTLLSIGSHHSRAMSTLPLETILHESIKTCKVEHLLLFHLISIK